MCESASQRQKGDQGGQPVLPQEPVLPIRPDQGDQPLLHQEPVQPQEPQQPD